ncbi:MAG: heat-inducible transcriptional repressor HrcA [Halofilum sp. (in: g-proteobacteria)]|nr:heat-inducible transcriptional repressor HrcA [Halofilum sp. (in: g-proteobacteria)]
MSRQQNQVPPDQQLSERAEHVLRTLVEQYIIGGQPVSSRTLSRVSGLGLSAATMRNVMYDLEEQGYLRAPHTSAGRIPTEQGYRLFVDKLLQMHPVDQLTPQELQQQLELDADAEPKNLVESVSSFLSGFTRMAGVVTLPRRDVTVLRYIEFLPLGDRRVLVILVINDHEVQNRVIHTDRDYEHSELEVATNYLNQKFAGRNLGTIRRDLQRELEATRKDVHRMMDVLVEMAGKAFADEEREPETPFVLAGETNLVHFEELSDVDKLRALFDTFRQKRDLYDLLERSATADGLQIYIGRESGYEVMDDLSIVTSPYSQDGEVVGVLGVIGPSRMAYDRVISVVDVTSRLLGAALNSRN